MEDEASSHDDRAGAVGHSDGDSARAVVLLSGGLDSATVLAIAQTDGLAPHALSFDYGQLHRQELHAARDVAAVGGAVEHRVITLDLRAIGGSALTDASLAVPKTTGVDDRASPTSRPSADGDESAPRAAADAIPITYVPARNTVFLSIALGWAEVLGARAIYLGVNAVDYSGYPDCRPEYIDAFQRLANLATRAGVEGETIEVRAPLINLSKAEIIRRGLALGVDYALTHSCYDPAPGSIPPGRPCGACDACRLRAAGFGDAGVPDPALERWHGTR